MREPWGMVQQSKQDFTSYSSGFGWRVVRHGAGNSLSPAAPTGLCQPQQARGKKAGWLTCQLPCVLHNSPSPGDRARGRSPSESRLFLLRSSSLAPFLPSVFVIVGGIVLELLTYLWQFSCPHLLHRGSSALAGCIPKRIAKK